MSHLRGHNKKEIFLGSGKHALSRGFENLQWSRWKRVSVCSGLICVTVRVQGTAAWETLEVRRHIDRLVNDYNPKSTFKIWKDISGRSQILALNMSKKMSGAPRLYVKALDLLMAI